MSPARRVGLAIAGALLIALSAQLVVPMEPVPMTLQSWAVLVVAGAGGSVIGVGAVALYLGLGAVGLPVFAKGASGLAPLVGPTGGFLFGFLVVALAVGWATERWAMHGSDRLRRARRVFVLMIAGHALLFLPGVAVLAAHVGLTKAIEGGAGPFVVGALVKVVLATATVVLLAPWTRAR